MAIKADMYPVGVTVQQIITACGGLTALGRVINRNASTIIKWKIIPNAHVETVLRMSGIPLEKIRPDLAAARAPLLKEAA